MCSDGNPNVVLQSLRNWAISATTKYDVPLERMADNYSFVISIIGRSMPDIIPSVCNTILASCENRAFVRRVLANSNNVSEKYYATSSLLRVLERRMLDATTIIRRAAK